MTLHPGRGEFDKLRQGHSIVPVWREVVSDLETPVSAYMKLAAQGGTSFLLESVEQGERWGRYSFVGIDPFLTLLARDGKVTSGGSGAPLEALREQLETNSAPVLEGLPPFFSGGVGYLGYDLVRGLERLPQTTNDDVGAPEMMVMFPRVVVGFDHLRQRATIVCNVTDSGDYSEAERRVDEVAKVLGSPLPYKVLEATSSEWKPPPSTMTKQDFEDAIRRAQSYITDGDIFQVVLSHRFSRTLSADPFDVYRALRLVNPSPYMFFINHPEIAVVGSSPEPLVKVEQRSVVQRPIAGTRPRGSTEEEDQAAEEELRSDVKERAEHVMLVDLSRNDVGRVSEYGSVEVTELLEVERYSHVMHLVSQVTGRLKDEYSALDALYASFPAGTVSGAPKIRAMEIIDELEPTRRGPYAGVVGYFDFSGNLDTCIALRTGYVVDGTFHVQAGAGIVADSDPDSEWEETVNKAGALLAAVEAAEQASPRK